MKRRMCDVPRCSNLLLAMLSTGDGRVQPRDSSINHSSTLPDRWKRHPLGNLNHLKGKAGKEEMGFGRRLAF